MYAFAGGAGFAGLGRGDLAEPSELLVRPGPVELEAACRLERAVVDVEAPAEACAEAAPFVAHPSEPKKTELAESNGTRSTHLARRAADSGKGDGFTASSSSRN